MILCIFVLSTNIALSEEDDKLESLRKSPIPKLPRKLYTFTGDERYLNEEMFNSEAETLHTLHNWIPLSSDARGYVHFNNYESYDLSDPYTVSINRTHDGPGYMLSAFHQLHCLSYLVQHYQKGYGGTNLTQEVAHHSAHCFDYIRQAIMCAGDTSLEGKTEAGPGWGSVHECVDYDALLGWANENSAEKWRNALMPGEAIL
ncbi:hypothetical protein WHR41_08062 [Cladosporium halotolerans]|uniref:Oxidase ustYa n=1 Tax=Cladosporium halotolerans TaxID=1052096 RepID=A0AB34KJ17_9PEZI